MAENDMARTTAGGTDTWSATPADRIYATVASMWTAVLELADVKPDDNFLTVGGESLLAIQLRSRILDAYGVEMSIRQILLGSPASIAREISAVWGASVDGHGSRAR